ncbi:MAG: acyl-CoA dehydrogenase family protein [Sandaracinaceae bacterium]
MTDIAPIDVVKIASEMVGTLRARSAEIEEGRRVPRDLSDALGRTGLYRMLAPREVGGLEVRPTAFARALEVLATGDAAAAWTVMTSSSTGMLLAYLAPDVARAILDEAPNAALAGVFAPSGRAVPEGGGYRVSGRWQWASGCENARWRTGGVIVMDGSAPRAAPGGGPEIRSCLFRADDTRVIDTWRVAGMRGTGSHDLEVKDAFVRADHTVCVFQDAPRHDGPLFRFPLFGLLATGVSAVGLGIARAALDHVIELARTKRSRGGSKSMAESELVQVRVASAEAELSAARAGVHAVLEETYAHAERGAPLEDLHRARLRMAATFAAQASARAVDAAYTLAGGAAVWDESPLQRHLRDVHVMTQHLMVGEPTLKPVGRVLLGLPTDTSQL